MIKTELQHDGQLLHVTLDTPPGNIIDHAMTQALRQAVREASERPGVKALRFEGAGEHFCFGASVQEHAPDKVAGMLHRFHGLFRVLIEAAVPTMAVVKGRCLGGGMELAAWCSWVFASQNAVFGQPEVRLAVIPPIASVLFPWRLGGGAALDLCVSGRTWAAAEARERGLVESVCADPRAASDAFFAEHLAPRSATALRFAERAARRGLERALDVDLPAIERLYLDDLMATHDAVEGITAFIEKRTPRFENK
ncbi:MAG: enoyl-CoA hydratase/isomerase family protein [Deltaproteobacteria bacterium]|nr:enoyl-CoA hydratase/isomerase family protein [Deltaproteobacteria bacterium]